MVTTATTFIPEHPVEQKPVDIMIDLIPGRPVQHIDLQEQTPAEPLKVLILPGDRVLPQEVCALPIALREVQEQLLVALLAVRVEPRVAVEEEFKF